MDYNKQHFVCDQNTRIVILGFWLDYINNSFKVTERLFFHQKKRSIYVVIQFWKKPYVKQRSILNLNLIIIKING